jgi:hypothetical protein
MIGNLLNGRFQPLEKIAAGVTIGGGFPGDASEKAGNEK